ncbi:MAG: molybdopterin-dependent oxidoreductase [Eggerthellaceae bacterium]|jgi:anaerobic dimethyl sulfoxide reductase subunit A
MCDRAEQGEWVTSACYFGCGGRCVNRSLVVDGKVVRQKTDDTHPDTPDNPQQRGCPRGRMLHKAMTGRDRLSYPLKRKHWHPGGVDVNGHLRGRDEWERISWDEALDMVASEVSRIKEAYGSRSILATNYELRPLGTGLYCGAALNAYGGCTATWGQASQGAFPLVGNMMKGSFNLGRLDFADRFSIRKAKLIVMWGQNPSWSSAGNPAFHYLQAKKAGARIVFIDPWCNPTMQALADEWIAVRPGTDTALLLGIAYEMIDHGWQDQAFLDRYCVGFDAAHMPERACPQENFSDYVAGTYDGLPKTPEWASEICGVPPRTIRRLAYDMSHVRPMSLRASHAPARTDNGYTFAQAFYTVGWMTGNVGFPGAEVSAGGSGGNMAFGGPALIQAGPMGVKLPENPICAPPRGGGMLARGCYDPNRYYGICMSEMWDAVLNGRYHDFVHGEQPIDIRMIWKVGVGHRMNQDPDFSKAVAAYRKVEFAVASDVWMNNDCLYSDIVLPAVSPYERDFTFTTQMNREACLVGMKTVDPPEEARDDLWIEQQLAKRWGVEDKLPKVSMRQIGFNQLSGARIVCDDQQSGSGRGPSDEHGSAYAYEPLVSVNCDDLERWGVSGTPHKGRVPLSIFLENGFYQVARHPGDPFVHVPYAAYVSDPQAHPLSTASGKFEICCPALVDRYREFGFSDIAPVAHYVPARDGYEDVSASEYPLQSISIHTLGRAHSTFDNVEELHELFPDDILVNPLDAQDADLEDGAIACVVSRYGKMLRRVRLTNLVMPGVVVISQGAWADLCDADGIDYGGCSNTVQGSQLSGEGQSTWNTTRVRLEDWKGPMTPADTARPRRFAQEGPQSRSHTMVPSSSMID